MRRKNRHLVFALTIFLFAEVFAFLSFWNLFLFEYLIWEKEDIPSKTYRLHIWIMGSLMIVANGQVIVLFRLLTMVRTAIVKYIHALGHTMILCGSMYGYVIIHNFIQANSHPHLSFKNIHTLMGGITFICYSMQWLLGKVVYLYVITNQKSRKLFASWHNFMGICVLQIAIATACLQFQDMSYEIDLENHHAGYAMCSMIIYGVIINSIVLNPYLEWHLVGPL